MLGQRGNRQDGGSRARDDSIGEVGADDSAKQRREQDGGRRPGGLLAYAMTEDDSIPELYSSSAFNLQSHRYPASVETGNHLALKLDPHILQHAHVQTGLKGVGVLTVKWSSC